MKKWIELPSAIDIVMFPLLNAKPWKSAISFRLGESSSYRVQLFSPMFENPFLHPWWGYWKRVSTAILTYVWKSWVPEEHRWGESKENQLAILTHVWNMGETAHRWGESKENQLAILTHVYIHGCWKVSNFTRVYRCTDMTLGLTSLDAEKCLTSPVFTDALTWLWDWLL